MNNGKQSEQLLKVLGGHSASLDRTSKCRGLSEQPLYSGGHKAMQHETRNWNNFDKCEPEQQYRLLTLHDQCLGHKIDTPPFPLGSLKPGSGSFKSEHLEYTSFSSHMFKSSCF